MGRPYALDALLGRGLMTPSIPPEQGQIVAVRHRRYVVATADKKSKAAGKKGVQQDDKGTQQEGLF